MYPWRVRCQLGGGGVGSIEGQLWMQPQFKAARASSSSVKKRNAMLVPMCGMEPWSPSQMERSYDVGMPPESLPIEDIL